MDGSRSICICIIWGVGGFKIRIHNSKKRRLPEKMAMTQWWSSFLCDVKTHLFKLAVQSWMVIDRQDGCGRSTESWSSHKPAIGAWWGILENKLPQTNYHDMENPWLLGIFWLYSHHFIVIIVASAIVISIISITILVSFSHFLFLLPLPLPFMQTTSPSTHPSIHPPLPPDAGHGPVTPGPSPWAAGPSGWLPGEPAMA